MDPRRDPTRSFVGCGRAASMAPCWRELGLLVVLLTTKGTSQVPDERPKAIDVTKPVLREPSVQDYWHFLRNYQEVPLKDFDPQRAPQVLRVSKLDDDRFQQLVRDGVPFVVDDCTDGFGEGAISDFECPGPYL
eukprot:Skav222117  [mRNA]  locus=scaffold1181:479148:485771:- [translate_table: standard]